MSFAKHQLLPGENIILVARQHVLTLARAVLLNLLSIAILVSIAVYLKNFWPLALLVFPLALLAWEILVRHRMEYVVTDRRIVRQEGVFSVQSFDAPLDKINNVFHEQSLGGRVFGYGTVGIETASEQGTTLFEMIPQPVKFKNAIVQQRDAFRAGSAGRGAAPQAVDVPKLLGDLAALRDRGVLTTAEFEEKKRALLERL